MACKKLVDDLLRYLYKNLTACILVCSFRKHEGDYIGFKFRGTDIDHRIPLDISVTEEIINNTFNGYTGERCTPDAENREAAVLEPVVCLGGRDKYTVIDIQHKFKPAIVNAEPLFAYKALDSVKNSGKEVRWEKVILGRRDDDSILSAGSEINFRTNFFHWIIAGSRSGKGVMTLNLLAAAISSGKPVFYLDNKPDMASMFRSSQLSGGKMFCIEICVYEETDLDVESLIRGIIEGYPAYSDITIEESKNLIYRYNTHGILQKFVTVFGTE